VVRHGTITTRRMPSATGDGHRDRRGELAAYADSASNSDDRRKAERLEDIERRRRAAFCHSPAAVAALRWRHGGPAQNVDAVTGSRHAGAAHGHDGALSNESCRAGRHHANDSRCSVRRGRAVATLPSDSGPNPVNAK
jgi:hypothetical protein